MKSFKEGVFITGAILIVSAFVSLMIAACRHINALTAALEAVK